MLREKNEQGRYEMLRTEGLIFKWGDGQEFLEMVTLRKVLEAVRETAMQVSRQEDFRNR